MSEFTWIIFRLKSYLDNSEPYGFKNKKKEYLINCKLVII